ncbi:MAG: peptidylprolyl isomerase [Alphaproteobacteria bacterium]
MASRETLYRTIIIGVLGLCVIILVVVARLQGPDSEGESAALRGGITRLGDPVVAQVNKTPIYLSDVRVVARAAGRIDDGETLMPSTPVFKTVLDELIDQRLLSLEAFTLSLDQKPEAKRRLLQARERVLGNVLVEEHLKVAVTDGTARQMFEAQAALRDRGPQVRARHILLSDEASAKQIWDRLEKGESFEALALAYSMDRASRESAGDLGYFTRDMLGSILTDIAFGAEVGSRVPPFKTETGWHILEVMDRRQAPEPKFEDVREDIIKLMTYDEIKILLEGLHAKADIQRYSLSPEKIKTTP